MLSVPIGGPFRILLAEGMPGSRLVETLLAAAGPEFVIAARADSLEETLSALDAGVYDALLLDLDAVGSGAVESFDTVRERAGDLPIIVLSSVDDPELGLWALHRGAQDFLVKTRLDPDRLGRAIRYAIERGQIERALAHERDLLNALLEQIPDLVFFKDLDGRFLRADRPLIERLGRKSPDEVLGRSDFDFLTPEDAQRTFADEQQVIRTGEPLTGEARKKTLPDGRVRWTLTTKVPLRDRTGRIIGTTGISRDITELKALEEELSAERNLLRSVIDNLPAPIYAKDREGRYLLNNTAHVAFLGASSASEPLGRTVLDFFPNDLGRHLHVQDMEVIQTGQALMNDEQLMRIGGRDRWISSSKVPLLDARGQVFGLVCIGRDITGRKAAQERLEAVNADLEKALAQLKAAHLELQSTQLQLIEAEKMKTIGRLAAGVAHEVKNPLAIITMGLDYPAQQTFEEGSAVPLVIKDIREAVWRADVVIRGMLDYSAPRTLEPEAGDLNQVIEHALLLVRGEMQPGRHHVVRELQPDLPRVRLDRLKMGQVFVNLLTNSLHAMPEGGTLTVRTSARQLTGVGGNIADERSESFQPGEPVVIAEIEDTGHGVPDGSLAKVFDPFFTTKPTGKGTGLGLSVARSIITLHGGTISIGNRESGGAKVTLLLKVHENGN